MWRSAMKHRGLFRYLFSVCCWISFWSVNELTAGEIRTWTAASGGFTVEAEFIELKPGDVVHLRTKDGRDVDVPLDRLSPGDREIIGQPTKTPPKTEPTIESAPEPKR